VEAVDQTTEPRSPGSLLAAERERQGLSRGEVAQRLHMSASQIEAIESGEYQRLPKGTFLRGFVRNYCKVLGIDPGPLLSELAEAAPRAPSPDIVVPSQNIRFDPLGERLSNPYVKAAVLAAVLLSLGFAGMYWWLFIKPKPPAAGASRPPAVETPGPPQQPAVPPIAPAEAPVQEPAEPSAPAPAQSAPNPSVPVQPAPAKVEPAKEAEPKKASRGAQRVIRLRFRGESWVEVRDGQGNVLVSRLHEPGTEAEVSGRPPLSVIVGNAPDVRMTVDEREFPLEPHTRVAVARLTVE
jgi:cytoskeleton protein RodZ